ncbi:head maturation protease, ClpP-related [Thalassovita aquimarina]|uniref:ATP-dependent Clp protease proteolytic subunit n=1 Tax=Thalassovita aquimarina TaxID=2785917 RepID=A0ABS5HSZ4_9RHOB|nr:head maturation protease, ClpP-related [Thalassovita aquimarina]MBR9651907.1 Clp protease ClpP [Thalassovita aquimarina]
MTILVDGELVLYGFVGDDFWGDGFTAAQVIDALAMQGRDADVTVRINSGGGYTDDGIAIYNALKAHRGDVSVVVDAIAASSASVIAMAGDSITMRAGSLMMIHDPARFTWGNAGDHEKSTEQLNKLADLMADIYAEQTGEDAGAIREDMKDELWLTGEEAVDRGFATDTEGGRAKAVAAFDYRVYAQAPKKLVAMARKEKWSFQAATRKAASAAQSKDHEKETPTMAPKPEAADKTPASPAPANGVEGASAADVKARIKAITEDDAAKGHEVLAKHLAFDTDMPAEDAIAALKAAAGDAPTAEAGDAPDPAGYQASRSAAADLAQPAPGNSGKPKATINTGGIYARRRAGKEA